MSKASKQVGLIALCGIPVFLCFLAIFLVKWKPVILLVVFVFYFYRELGSILMLILTAILNLILYPFILVISKFYPSYTFRRPRKSRTLSDRCGIGFRELRDNNYDAVKLDSVSVAPLDETDLQAFRNTSAYKKAQAAYNKNSIKQYASY